MTDDPEATQLRPRQRPEPRPKAVPPGAWDNAAAWQASAPPADEQTQLRPAARSGEPGPARSSGAAHRIDDPFPPRVPDTRRRGDERQLPGPTHPGAKRGRTTVREAEVTGPQRSTTRERPAAEAPLPEEAPVPHRVGLLLVATTVLAALAFLVPTWLTPAETPTGRAISVAHGPAPRKAEAAKLPAEVADLKRDPARDAPGLPFGQIDRALFVDAQQRRPVVVMTQRVQVGSLEDYDQRTGMQASRFGRVSCGQRYDALQCTMLLDGGTLSATTIDKAWEPEDLANIVRQLYARLP